MPLYEYRCEDCGKAFEMLRRMSEADNAAVCPKCESPRAQRQFSTFAAVGANTGGAMEMGCAKPGCGARTGFG